MGSKGERLKTLYQTEDGEVFNTPKEAEMHEYDLVLGKVAVHAMRGFRNSEDFKTFLIEHKRELLWWLNAVK